MLEIDIKKLVACCQKRLDVASAKLPAEYSYESLPLCVIDAVWSIGVRYEGVKNVVDRYIHWDSGRITEPQDNENQKSISSFIADYEKYGLGTFTNEIYQNRQRTSTRNGILKSEAVLRFAQVLKNHSVEHMEDVARVIDSETFETDIKSMPGQRSGVSLTYFFMLAGSEKLIKPDRMIIGFVEDCLGRTVGTEEATQLILAVAKQLGISPRLLDYTIWQYQRGFAQRTSKSRQAITLERPVELPCSSNTGSSDGVVQQTTKHGD